MSREADYNRNCTRLADIEADLSNDDSDYSEDDPKKYYGTHQDEEDDPFSNRYHSRQNSAGDGLDFKAKS